MDSDHYTILIVDDNPNNLFSLRALLGRLPQCQVVEALSGEVALGVMLDQSVDLVLLDIQMPGMNGFEIAQHMKMTERTKDIPVIFITAVFRDDEFIRHGYEIGAVDYLTKPVDDNLLLNRIQLYLRLFNREKSLTSALTDLRQRELDLEEANRELEHRVLERTSELEQKNKQLEKEMAERKQIQRALVDSERKFRLLFECLTSGWMLLQEEPDDLRIVEVNPAFLSLSGHKREWLLRGNASTVIPELAVQHREGLQRILQEGGAYPCECFFSDFDRHTVGFLA